MKLENKWKWKKKNEGGANDRKEGHVLVTWYYLKSRAPPSLLFKFFEQKQTEKNKGKK